LRLFVFLLSVFFGVQQAASEEILSKRDMAAMFNLSLNEWKQNVIALSNSGIASYDSLPPYEYTLIAEAPLGRVVTTPSFNSANEAPWKISVSIVYTEPESYLFLPLSDDELRHQIRMVFEEMRPEYSVMTEVYLSRSESTVVKSFQAFQVGDFPLMDELSLETKGCRKPCIHRLD